MAHYAKVREGKVVEVIVAEATFFDTFVDNTPGEWIQTSYNTRGNIHYEPNSNTPSPTVYEDVSGSRWNTLEAANISGSGSITTINQSETLALRGNYAGIGFTYDSTHDAFYAPKPYNSWILDTGSFTWEPPVAYPTGDVTGSYTGSYQWSESDLNWVTGSI